MLNKTVQAMFSAVRKFILKIINQWDEEGGNNPEKYIQQCTDFDEIHEFILTSAVNHRVGLVTYRCHEASRCRKCYGHKERHRAQF